MHMLQDVENLYKNKNYGEALTKLQACLRKSPHNQRALYLKGLIFEEEDQVENAEKYFLQCLKECPQNQSYLRHLGILKFNKKQYTESRGYFQKCLKINRNCYQSNYYLGLINENENQLPEAMKNFKKSLDLNPNFKKCKNSLKRLYKKTDKSFDLQKKICQVSQNIQKLQKQKSLCVQCNIEECSCASQTCGHSNVCSKCSQQMRKCLTCGAYGKFFKVFWV